MLEEGITEKSVVVVAHPDDEIIWMSSIIRKVDKILICFQDESSSIGFGIGRAVDYYRMIKYRSCSSKPIMSKIGCSREKVLRNYPLNNIESLGLHEAGTFGLVDWSNPKRSPFGIRLDVKNRSSDMSVLRFSIKRNIRLIRRKYEENYKKLVVRLKGELEGVRNVFTHNPWGEYGHPDHIQVNEALVEIQKEMGFNLYVTTYCGGGL